MNRIIALFSNVNRTIILAYLYGDLRNFINMQSFNLYYVVYKLLQKWKQFYISDSKPFSIFEMIKYFVHFTRMRSFQMLNHDGFPNSFKILQFSFKSNILRQLNWLLSKPYGK